MAAFTLKSLSRKLSRRQNLWRSYLKLFCFFCRRTLNKELPESYVVQLTMVKVFWFLCLRLKPTKPCWGHARKSIILQLLYSSFAIFPSTVLSLGANCFLQKGVWAVAIVTEHLVASGSYDRTIKVWGLGSSKGCLRTLYGHLGPVWTMICRNKFIASGSQDRLVSKRMLEFLSFPAIRGNVTSFVAMATSRDLSGYCCHSN